MVARPVHILNGPNLNLLGSREPDIYGTSTLADIERMCAERLAEYDLEMKFDQSNDEGALVDMVQAARRRCCALALALAALAAPVSARARLRPRPLMPPASQAPRAGGCLGG